MIVFHMFSAVLFAAFGILSHQVLVTLLLYLLILFFCWFELLVTHVVELLQHVHKH